MHAILATMTREMHQGHYIWKQPVRTQTTSDIKSLVIYGSIAGQKFTSASIFLNQ